jgi:multiple sugar transport system permease protein
LLASRSSVAATRRVSAASGRVRRLQRVRWTPHLFLALPAAYLAIFQVYPIAKGVWLSLTATSVYNPSAGVYVGAGNYRAILSSGAFWHSLKITCIYTGASVIGAVLIGLAVAHVLHGMRRGRGLARALIAVPWAMPSVVTALVFTWTFDDHYGILNYFISSTGIAGANVRWLDDPNHALWAVLIPTIWQLFPVCALVLLAAMQSVPQELVEAAQIDGAPERRIFWHVTLPTVAPAIALITLLTSIWSIRRFDTIWLLTEGGPGESTNTIVNSIYRETFVNANLGHGAAIGVLGMLLSLIVTVTYFLLSRRLATT